MLSCISIYVEVEIVCTSFIYVKVSSDCKYLVTQIDFEVGHELFSCSGKRLLDPGYTRTMHWQALSQDEHLPELKPNQMIPVTEVC